MNMKIVCIKNQMPARFAGYKYLTLGKTYQVVKERFDVNCYEIIDDNNESTLYHITCFNTLENWRDKQVDKIIN